MREENEVRRVEEEVMHAVLTANPVGTTASGVLAGEIKEMGDLERGSGGVLAEEPFSTCKTMLGLLASEGRA